MMKKLKVILSVLCAATLLVGCGSNTKEQSSTNETKQEEKQGIKKEDNVKKEEKEREELKQKLQSLQPGNFQTEMGKSYQTLKYPNYEDLLRYPEEHKEKKYMLKGVVNQVELIDEDGSSMIYVTDEISGQEYVLGQPAGIGSNVLVNDGIMAATEFFDIMPIEQTNGFGATKIVNKPVFYIDYLYDKNFVDSKYQVSVYLERNLDNKYNWELAGESKDFEDLKDKKGYVFALKAKDGSGYYEKYIYAEKGNLYYYTPTINGINIKGENEALGELLINR